MTKVLVIVNAEVTKSGKLVATSPATRRMVVALEKAIYQTPEATAEAIPATALLSRPPADPETIYCPLTIDLPPSFEFPARKIFQACRDIEGRRQWVERELGIATGLNQNKSWFGDLWLPVVLTAKGVLYGEAIAEGELPNSYCQPVDFPDSVRQTLYRVSYNLLEAIAAPPAVYLLQFGMRQGQILYDRLWPFPAAPATASLGVQVPDLYECHWLCLTHQPLSDLTIAGYHERHPHP